MFNIYIPSKGRSNNRTTAKICKQENINYKVVVEPQDLLKYSQFHDDKNILVLDKNNQGLTYARNFIKNYSINAGELWHWQIDDDIYNFRVRNNNKNIKSTAKEVLGGIESFVLKFKNIDGAGPRYTIFAFSQNKQVSINQQISSCILVNNSISIKWDPEVVEDTDYSLQLLKRGLCTLLFNTLLIETAPTMKLSGGMTDNEYLGNGRYLRQLALTKKYPGIFDLVIKQGKSKIKPSRIWRSFKQTPVLIK